MSRGGRLFELRNAVVVVSGASKGIGASLAGSIHDAGAHVVGFARRSPDVRPSFDFEECDVLDGDRFHKICATVVDKYGRIDGYIHAAGISTPEPNQRLNTFRDTIEANLVGAYQCCRVVAPLMSSAGAIVLVSSIAARLGFPDNPGYVASKGAISALTRALAVDFAPAIRVNSIAPGYVRTAMTSGSYDDQEKRDQRTGRTLLGRWGEPDDLVGPAIFLLSHASRFMTGQELVIDGGWTAKGL